MAGQLKVNGVTLATEESGTVTLENPQIKDSSNNLVFDQSGSRPVLKNVDIKDSSNNLILDQSGTNPVLKNVEVVNNSSMMFRNKLINGDMRIDQRNAGAAVTGVGGTPGVYSLDRFRNGFPSTTARYSIQQVNDAPAGFYNSLKVTITTPESSLASNSVSVIGQIIEGFNCYDIKTTGAQKPTAFSFWVKSSKTGTFVVEFGDFPNARAVSATYTISSANTWEYKTIAFPADTGATWTASNSSAAILQFFLFAGSDFTSGTLQTTWASYTNANRAVGQSNLADTNGATFYITGVQLEVGTVATQFEHRPYGAELSLCKRYYATGRVSGLVGYAGGRLSSFTDVNFEVEMRAIPTAYVSYNGTVGTIRDNNNGTALTGWTTIEGTNKYIAVRNSNDSVGAANHHFSTTYFADSEL